jgi:hypothetical protein
MVIRRIIYQNGRFKGEVKKFSYIFLLFDGSFAIAEEELYQYRFCVGSRKFSSKEKNHRRVRNPPGLNDGACNSINRRRICNAEIEGQKFCQ